MRLSLKWHEWRDIVTEKNIEYREDAVSKSVFSFLPSDDLVLKESATRATFYTGFASNPSAFSIPSHAETICAARFSACSAVLAKTFNGFSRVFVTLNSAKRSSYVDNMVKCIKNGYTDLSVDLMHKVGSYRDICN